MGWKWSQPLSCTAGALQRPALLSKKTLCNAWAAFLRAAQSHCSTLVPRTTTRHPNSSSSRPQPLRKKGLLWNESVKYREIQVSFSDTQSTAWLVRLTWGNGTGPATLIRQSPWDRGISFKAVLRVGWRCHLSHRKNCPRLPGKIVKRQQRFP